MAAPQVSPTPPPSRPRSGSNRLRKRNMGLVTNVQKRDIKILLDVHDNRVLTTHHITDIYFDSPRCARRRLLYLYRHALLDRFRPQPEVGSAPDHYVLAKAGAEIVAAQLGRELKEVFDRSRMKKLAYSPFIEHLLAINTFYSRLARACRQLGDHYLVWQGEITARKSWEGIVRPDGIGRIETPGRFLTMFLEMDMGTEPLARLTDKLETGYRMAAQTGNGRPDLLLFCFPTPAREANARRVLHPIGMTIATTWMDFHNSDPLGEIWLPLGGERRMPVHELPVEPVENGSSGYGRGGGTA